MIKTVQSTLLSDSGFTLHGFTERQGGVSQGPYESLNLSAAVGDNPDLVNTNLLRLKSFCKTELPLLRVKQVHGATIVTSEDLENCADEGWQAAPTVEADGILDRSGQRVLAVQVADCAPVLLADPASGAVAAVHAGWRSLKAGILRSAIRLMCQDGAMPKQLIAAIGPRICHNCYEVGQEVARFFPESCDPSPTSADKFLLDLGWAAEVSLLGAGMTSANIEKIELCTRCHSDRFFSYRTANPCGRFLGFIAGKTAQN